LRLAKAREEKNRREEMTWKYYQWNSQCDVMKKELERLREEMDQLRTDFSALGKEIACLRSNGV
jgi:uncharacterized coiled-coil DUF342 family protein